MEAKEMAIRQRKTPTAPRPLLTIAIPTYNRCRYLKELLVVLFEQLRGRSDVELLISDNATPDETPEAVEEFVKQGLEVRYIRNDTNIGPDANFLQCFELARGKYVWIFGDDDLIVPGGISTIVGLLIDHEYSLVYVSPYWFRNDYLAERKSDYLGRFAEEYYGGVQFARRVGTMMNFISSIIVNKEQFYASQRDKDYSDLIGTSLSQLGYILPVLADSSRNLIVWERLVAARAANTGGFGVCEVFGVNFKRIIEKKLAGERNLLMQLENRNLQGWFPTAIMMMRRGAAPGLKTESMRTLLEPHFKRAWRYWIYVFPLLTFPMAGAELWFKIVIFADRMQQVLLAIFRRVFFFKNRVRESNGLRLSNATVQRV
jgi:abequosyltransferase